MKHLSTNFQMTVYSNLQTTHTISTRIVSTSFTNQTIWDNKEMINGTRSCINFQMTSSVLWAVVDTKHATFLSHGRQPEMSRFPS